MTNKLDRVKHDSKQWLLEYDVLRHRGYNRKRLDTQYFGTFKLWENKHFKAHYMSDGVFDAYCNGFEAYVTMIQVMHAAFKTLKDHNEILVRTRLNVDTGNYYLSYENLKYDTLESVDLEKALVSPDPTLMFWIKDRIIYLPQEL